METAIVSGDTGADSNERPNALDSLSSPEAVPAGLPANVRKFLAWPGTMYHGSFNHFVEEPAVLKRLEMKAPKDHLTVQFDNWPDTPRIWYVCSEPEMKVKVKSHRPEVAPADYGTPEKSSKRSAA